MTGQYDPPRVTRSSTRSGLASLFSFGTLTAKLPPSFSISTLLRCAVELDHDSHLEPGGLSNERKREASLDASIPTPSGDGDPPSCSGPALFTGDSAVRGEAVPTGQEGQVGAVERLVAPQAEGKAKKSKKRRKASTQKLDPPAHSAPGEGSKRTKKNKARKIAKQQAERAQGFREHGHQARPSTYKKYVSLAEPVAIAVDFDFDNLPASSCGYQAKPEPQGLSEAVTMSLSSLLEQGYTVEAWDGMSNKVFVDPVTSKIFAACVSRPSDASFDKAVEDAFEAMEHARAACGFNLEDWLHRRGHFPALNVGISYGQGQKAAQNLDNKDEYRAILQGLINNPAIVRLAHYASASFSMFCTKYLPILSQPVLIPPQQNAGGSNGTLPEVYLPPPAFNFGPQVTPFLTFDPTKGGHLVLPDLKVAIEFPAGSLILIPSATLTHANTPVQEGEVRVSFTQFSAGGIFRFVDNGFQTETQLLINNKEAYWRAIEDKKLRWKRGLRLWSTVDELLSGTRRAFEDPLEEEG